MIDEELDYENDFIEEVGHGPGRDFGEYSRFDMTAEEARDYEKGRLFPCMSHYWDKHKDRDNFNLHIDMEDNNNFSGITLPNANREFKKWKEVTSSPANAKFMMYVAYLHFKQEEDVFNNMSEEEKRLVLKKKELEEKMIEYTCINTELRRFYKNFYKNKK